MGCGGSTQARSPSRRFQDPTPQARANPNLQSTYPSQQPMMGAYPSAPPQQTFYNQQHPGYGQPPPQGYYQGNPGYAQPTAPQGDPAYPPPPPAYPPQQQPMQPTAPPSYPVQQSVPAYSMQPATQTTVIVKERRRSNSGDGAMMLVGGLAMGAMMGAALSGSFSSLGSFD